METNGIINATEKFTKAASGRGLKAAGGIGAVLLGAIIIAKKLSKSPHAKDDDAVLAEAEEEDETGDDDVKVVEF